MYILYRCVLPSPAPHSNRGVSYFCFKYLEYCTGWDPPWARKRRIAGDQATPKPARADPHTG